MDTLNEAALSAVDKDRVAISNFLIAGKKDKIEILSSQSEQSVTFCIWEEDHTFGNPLRHYIMRNPNVVCCGYTIPHPSEAKIHLRIQTNETTTAVQAFYQGISDLRQSALILQKKYQEALATVASISAA